MRLDFTRIVRGRSLIVLGIGLCLAAGLAACGTASATTASVTATANCTRVRLPQSATGTISNVTTSSFQLTDTSGKVTTVQINSSTRITRIVTTSAASLTPGAIVQVTADTAGTTAQRIIVTPQSGTGNGSGFRGGGARGTPPAGLNPACATTRTPGRGTFFQGNQQGVRGTVQSASSTQVIVSDPQGQTLTFTITASTQILTTATGSASDLTQGSTAAVTGTLSGTTLVARTIVIQPAAPSAS